MSYDYSDGIIKVGKRTIYLTEEEQKMFEQMYYSRIPVMFGDVYDSVLGSPRKDKDCDV